MVGFCPGRYTNVRTELFLMHRSAISYLCNIEYVLKLTFGLAVRPFVPFEQCTTSGNCLWPIFFRHNLLQNIETGLSRFVHSHPIISC